jgi:hypothetical protein
MIHPKPNPLVIVHQFCEEHPDIFESLVQYLMFPGYGGFFLYSDGNHVTHAERKYIVKEKPKPS